MFRLSLLAGFVLLIMGAMVLNDRLTDLRTGYVTTATVIQMRAIVDFEGTTYAPVFRYTDENNQVITFEHNVSTNLGYWAIGDQVEIVRSQYNRFFLQYWAVFGTAFIFLALALICLTIAGGYYWSQRFFNSLQ